MIRVLKLDLVHADPLDDLNAASIRYHIALGPGRGGRHPDITVNFPLAATKPSRILPLSNHPVAWY